MTDDELRARLRRADPAAALTPISPEQTSELLEHTMTDTADPRTTDPRMTGSHSTGPRRRPWMVAAAAVLVLLAAGAGYLLYRPGNTRSAPPPAAAGSTTSGKTSITHLTAAGGAGKCKAPTPEGLATGADFAFAGSVARVDGDRVTLRVAKTYLGTATELVEITQPGGIPELQLVGTDRFEQGKSYLVAASQGRMLICGYSGLASASEVRSMYDRAF